jgi:hypothetical protein
MDEIRDDVKNGRYEAIVDGHLAELGYRLEGDRLLVVYTGVPGPIEGRGVAGRLMEAVVARAKHDGLTVVPLCSYARYWLDEHRQELGDLPVAG